MFHDKLVLHFGWLWVPWQFMELRWFGFVLSVISGFSLFLFYWVCSISCDLLVAGCCPFAPGLEMGSSEWSQPFGPNGILSLSLVSSIVLFHWSWKHTERAVSSACFLACFAVTRHELKSHWLCCVRQQNTGFWHLNSSSANVDLFQLLTSFFSDCAMSCSSTHLFPLFGICMAWTVHLYCSPWEWSLWVETFSYLRLRNPVCLHLLMENLFTGNQQLTIRLFRCECYFSRLLLCSAEKFVDKNNTCYPALLQIWDFWKVFKIDIWQIFWQALYAISW